ncbi:3-phosphoshikimate 1-carboxyvinyltransferase [Flavobacterium amniphilum]|uniref:3-phosphoshikimate 1-carboxyvinyltransferase n=1 Tax=Flavobacterium amniphilum TaxID=1834035 RepID=UPI00202A44DD|nr:3-phosphoshikimate 1-carboxyvinyltransferase [Flavobacterium amniphilum]MCL9806719.1 3-phosphoshikimate 1-carboxyvinyltransferase [Flavobacterium amniphilum]
MNLSLQKSKTNTKSVIAVSGSKSETNRLLLLQALYPNIILANVSNSDDSEVMTKALLSDDPIKDIHHAGTAMRFLTAYFSTQEDKEVVLTGSSRMKERPISILVDALRQLGAVIEYTENDGFPPLKITGRKITQNRVSLPANVSSQYISALLLVAPKLENGLELTLEGEITSIPYIKMTLALLNEIGVETSFAGNVISVAPKPMLASSQLLTVESDWSSASYWYSIIALSETGTEVELSSYKENSLQGDSALATIYKDFGVETVFGDTKIILRKINYNHLSIVNYQLNNCPDIAQTIAVTCFGLGMGCHLTGLHTLKIKETDRLEALKAELEKFGASVTITDETLTLEPTTNIIAGVAVKTYQDHRMAMAFAPLALKTNLVINEAEVVSKSYPDFWKDLQHVGFIMSEA